MINVITFLGKNIKVVLATLVFLFIVLWFQGCQKQKQLKAELKATELRYENNVRALNDTIRVTKNLVGELQSEKSGFVVKDVEELEKLNESLAEAVRKQKGEISSLIQAKAEADLRADSLAEGLVKYQTDSSFVYELSNEYEDEGIKHSWLSETPFFYDISSGRLTVQDREAKILENIFEIDLELGITEHEDSVIVFAKSKSPFVTFKNLESVTIQHPKPLKSVPKKFHIGPQVGAFYDGTKIRYGVGVGLTYSLIRL